jgi:large subunit ribosomal protein L3
MEFVFEKIGMSRTVSIPSTPVTLLKIKEMKILEAGEGKALVAYQSGTKKMNKSIEGLQKKYNLSKEFNRFATVASEATEAGEMDFSVLSEGATLKITAKTKGRGFTGVVKRYGFSGGPGSHGSRFHRAPGSVGNAEFPGRIKKGQKMPGQYGNANISVKNTVVSFDAENNILVVKGSIPGANGAEGRVRIVK